MANTAPHRFAVFCSRSLPAIEEGSYHGAVKMFHTAADAPTPDTSFRLLLQSELARRCSRNRQYSLRSFAHQLGVDPSTLSQWLRHRRPLTSRVIETIGQQLGLSPDRIRAYIDYEMRCPPVEAPHTNQLTPETLAALEHSHALAVLELIHLEAFTPDSRWIAARLDISADDVNLALHRLVSLDLLRMQSKSVWIDCIPSAVGAFDDLPEAQAIALHHHAGDWWVRSIRASPPEARELSSTTVAIHAGALPKAIDLITKCRQQVLEVLQEGPADEVYQLEMALFPITIPTRQPQATPEGSATT